MGTLSNERIKEAREQLEKIQADPELMERIRLEEAYEMDVATSINNARREGREEGKVEGEKKAKLETAKKMLEKGIAIETIIEVTELTRKEIEALR